MNLSQRNKIKFLIGVLVMLWLWEVQLCEFGFTEEHFRLSLIVMNTELMKYLVFESFQSHIIEGYE